MRIGSFAILFALSACSAPQLAGVDQTSSKSGSPAAARFTPLSTGMTPHGLSLVDSDGMTLYVFDRDQDGVSACKDVCVDRWPPLTAPAGAVARGDYGFITRDDGSRQVTYRRRPLYRWFEDTRPGEALGEGLANDTWHIATPR